jgi:glycerophosphoryl diester phosphodiesterase
MALVELLREIGLEHDAIVVSAYADQLVAVNEIDRRIPLAFVARLQSHVIEALEKGFDGALAWWPMVTPGLLSRVHGGDPFFVSSWTVNSGERAARLATAGSDAITTDDPAAIAWALGRGGSGSAMWTTRRRARGVS